jgi:hypothetical protein
MFAAAFMGMWGPLTVFGTHRIALFAIYYQADVSALAAIGVVMGLYDAFRTGRSWRGGWADAGVANQPAGVLPARPLGPARTAHPRRHARHDPRADAHVARAVALEGGRVGVVRAVLCHTASRSVTDRRDGHAAVVPASSR